MKKYFENIDFSNFWNEHSYYREECTGEELTDEMVIKAEQRLGFKLPESYIQFMKTRNGGKLINSFWLGEDIDGVNEYSIEFEKFFSISEEKPYGMFGKFSNEFWFTKWGYPRDIGVIIANTISGGHDMLYLDYRECGIDGEPKVSLCFQENDYKVVVLANSFEEFILELISEEEYNQFLDLDD